MTDYLHHVPGRLRVRSRSLRCDTSAQGGVLRRIRAMTGVRSIRHNAKAGSITVCYDPRSAAPDAILEVIENECLQARHPIAARVEKSKAAAGKAGGLTNEIGRMALGALVSRGVGFGLTSLLGVRS